MLISQAQVKEIVRLLRIIALAVSTMAIDGVVRDSDFDDIDGEVQ